MKMFAPVKVYEVYGTLVVVILGYVSKTKQDVNKLNVNQSQKDIAVIFKVLDVAFS